METIKLDFEKYVPGRSVRENVIACLPGNLETIKIRQRKDPFLVDRENQRLFVIESESCAPSSKKACICRSIEQDLLDRKSLYTRKELPRGMNILDFDAYIIAAAEYEGDEEWYETRVLGGVYEMEIFREIFPVCEDKTFHYALVPMFDKDEYLKDYAGRNISEEEKTGWSEQMEKYIYQRTGIDVDIHDNHFLVYQDECSFESLLSSINWFHDGQPTGIADDVDFLRRWDSIDDNNKSDYTEKAVRKIRMDVAVSGVDARVVVDNHQPSGEPDWDKASEYVEYQKGRYLRIVFIACFGEMFNGSLQFEISHERSGFSTKWFMSKPEKRYCTGEPLIINTQNFSLEQVLGSGYRRPAGTKDFVTIKMFHHNREVFCKDFQIRRIGA